MAEGAAPDLSRVVDFVDLGIVLLDPERRIVAWNDWLVLHSGCAAAELLGRDLFEAFPGLRGTRLEQVIGAALKSGQSAVLSRQLNPALLPLNNADGQLIIQSAVIRPMPQGGRAHCLIQIRDETASANRERLLRENQKALSRARQEADRANAAKSDFLANMSHEIRTPMNGVLGMAELLLGAALDEKQRSYAEAIRDSGERLLDILNDILDISKLEAGRIELDSIDFDLEAVVDDVVELNAVSALGKDLRIAALVHPSARGLFRGDPARLRQVLANLIGNAVKFTERGSVTIECRGTEAAEGARLLRVEVLDTGIGVPPEARSRLFQKFSQADSSITRRFGGTGLGLAISRQLVEAMGGTIDVESSRNGSRFWFTTRLDPAARPVPETVAVLAGRTALVIEADPFNQEIYRTRLEAWGLRVLTEDRGEPIDCVLIRSADEAMVAAWQARCPDRVLRIVAASQNTGRSLTAPVKSRVLRGALTALFDDRTGLVEAPPAVASRPARRVLLVEDNAINRRVARALLEEAGHAVDEATNGAEAIDRVAEAAYDILLMDIQMPVMGGLEATRRIRELPGPARRVPIVAMTANAMRGARETYLAAGMDGYVSKPIDIRAVLQVIDSFGAPESPLADSDAPVLDAPYFETLRGMLPGATFTGLVRDFLAGTIERRRRIEAIGAGGDLTLLRQEAHDLVSTAGNFGARRVEQGARALEAACEGGDRTAAAGLLAGLLGQTDLALSEISERLAGGEEMA